MSAEPTQWRSLPDPSLGTAESAPYGTGRGRGVRFPTTEPMLAGRTILHYRVLEKLGQGGMGVVYEARDLRLSRPVALKFPRTGMGQETLECLRREAQALAALNHPNIATIYGLCEAEGEVFLVMEFLPGRTLKSVIRDLRSSGLRLPLDRIVEYAAGIGGALAHAHRLGIIHRDVKSGNVMFTALGVPKLTDFGLARFLEAATARRSGTVLGTLCSMAPEQARGAEADKRSDIFSFGVLLYEMAAGCVPFRGSSEAEILSALLHREPEDLRRIRPDLPEEYVHIVGKALVKHPEHRYQDMEELLADLERIGPDEVPASATRLGTDGLPPTVTIQRPVRETRSKLRMAALIASTALIIGLASNLSGLAQLTRSRRAAAPEWYQTGRQLLVREDVPENVDRAIRIFQGALARNRNESLAEAALAEAYWKKYEQTREGVWIEKAGESCRRLVTSGATLPAVHVTLGLVRTGAGQPEEALADLQRALAVDPLNADACLGLGRAFERLGRSRDAEQSYMRAVQFRPADWRTHNALGRLYWSQGRYADAETQFRKVIELTPDNARGHSNLGGVLVMMGRYEDAARHLERSLSVRATPAAHSNLGTAYYFQRRYAAAAAQMEKAVALQPRNARLWGNLADAYRMLPGREKDSVQAYRLAIELATADLAVQPRDAPLRASLAVWWAALGNGRRAGEEIRAALREAPEDPAVQFRSALVLALCGRRHEAARALDRARRCGYSPEEIARHPDLSKLREAPKSGRGRGQDG